MDPMKPGGLIRALRLSQGKTQLALGEEIGVSDKAVSKWERGCGGPVLCLSSPRQSDPFHGPGENSLLRPGSGAPDGADTGRKC